MAALQAPGGFPNHPPPSPSPSPPPLQPVAAEEADAPAPADGKLQEAVGDNTPPRHTLLALWGRAGRVKEGGAVTPHADSAMCTELPCASCDRGTGRCSTAAAGTTRDSLDCCHKWGVRGSTHCLGQGEYVAPARGGGGMRRWPHRGRAPICCALGTRGSHNGAMGEGGLPE